MFCLVFRSPVLAAVVVARVVFRPLCLFDIVSLGEVFGFIVGSLSFVPKLNFGVFGARVRWPFSGLFCDYDCRFELGGLGYPRCDAVRWGFIAVFFSIFCFFLCGRGWMDGWGRGAWGVGEV